MKVLKTMKFKSAFSMSEFLRINRIDERDIKHADFHGDDITLHYYIETEEDD